MMKKWMILFGGLSLSNPLFPLAGINAHLFATKPAALAKLSPDLPASYGRAAVILYEMSARADDLRILPGRLPSLALRAPALEPRFNSKSAWWMAKELGHRYKQSKFFSHGNRTPTELKSKKYFQGCNLLRALCIKLSERTNEHYDVTFKEINYEARRNH
jgi:hypothetical protein